MGSGDLDNEFRNYRNEPPWLEEVWANLTAFFMLTVLATFLFGVWKLVELVV